MGFYMFKNLYFLFLFNYGRPSRQEPKFPQAFTGTEVVGAIPLDRGCTPRSQGPPLPGPWVPAVCLAYEGPEPETPISAFPLSL